MVLKLLFTIIVAVFIAVFTGFNLTNKCNIWLFTNIEKVPVVVTILISFATGILVTLPTVIFGRKKMTAEQARALADRLETKEKKELERKQKAAARAAAKPKPDKASKNPKTKTNEQNDTASQQGQE